MNYSIPQEVFVKAAEQYGTPLWLYDRATIEKRVKEVQVFDTVRFAQKACPNLSIVALVRKLGGVVDAVSAGEIVRALKAGFKGGQQKGKAPEIVSQRPRKLISRGISSSFARLQSLVMQLW